MKVEIKSLQKSFSTNRVLKGIDLDFSSGEIVGVVGENGSGKTTLFRCIAGLEDYEGDIKYGNLKIKDVIGFLPTNPYFISKITGKEYLQFVCNSQKIDINNIEKKNIFDLPLNRFADTYSTGMKKKLAITSLLLLKNDIFILDEPFNGVDIQSNILVKEIILKLKGLNKVVIVSSHIFSTLGEICDKMHHLKGGKIINSVSKENFAEVEENLKRNGIQNKIKNLIIQ